MYKIGYIEGYDSFNTISFASKQAQSSYFDNHTILTIDEYYPPYYTNIIKLSRNDLDYTTIKFNFVTLIFNNVRYYYFVTGINYVNEDVYEIVLTIDSVQTLMFELEIDNGVQIRESIKRWVGNEINRDYQRENVSKDDFMIKSFEYTFEKKYLVLLTSEEFSDPETYPTSFKDTSGKYIGSGLFVYVFPLIDYPDLASTLEVRVFIDGTQYFIGRNFDIKIPYNRLLSNPKVVNMFISTSPYLKQLMNYTFTHHYEEDEHGEVIEDYYELALTDNLNSINRLYSFRYDYSETQGEHDYKYYTGFNINGNIMDFILDRQVELRINNKLISKNTHTNVLFDEKFIPQLIDENYIQISYGEKLGSTSFPLSMLRDYRIRLYSTFDLISNARAYKITPEVYKDFNKEDAYNTIVATQSLESFNLISDAWENYQATHKGTLTTGLQLEMANNVFKFVKGSTNAVASQKVNFEMANQYDFGSRPALYYGNRNLQSKFSGANAKADFAMDMINTVANYKTNRENLEYTPNVVGQGSNLYSDTSTKSYTCFYQVQEVTDIVACARKLEYYGYAVNKVIDKKYINDLKNRYYYNIIQLTNVTIINKGSRMIPLEFIQDFANRLESGIRLFDIRSNDKFLDNLKYDNVEIEVITNE